MRLLKNIIALLLLLPLAGCYSMMLGMASFSPLSRLEYSSALSRAEKGDVKAQAKVGATARYACHNPADALAWKPPCDEAACVKWNTLAAEGGNADAQRLLAYMHERGECGLKRDWKPATKWYRKAAEQGDADAAATLARAYAVGEDIDRDDTEAAKWYLIAAKSGNHHAQMSLAHIYMSGIGVEQDKKQALEWGVKAAQSGDLGLQKQLAKLYLESGDYAEAYYWSSLSWARSPGSGDEIVFTDLDQHLTADQIAAIDGRVKADAAKQKDK